MNYKGNEIVKSGWYYRVIVSYGETWLASSKDEAKTIIDNEIIRRNRKGAK